MNCYVYRSNKKQGMYLYLVERDNFEDVPESLMKLLGEVVFSFEFDLSKDRKLVKAESEEVLRILKENGYFLQMPPAKSEFFGNNESLN
ncbi:YcgL domain-containing protein [uncultured Cocleimonas sp.]|uniref:YcgL domain-containing protein n=1 Tax=uncultured Cocleimonas sp. TaxID=1051587 RepID=UPI002607C2AB|nr:YcgL domain-containing protein [uncultured Cocleimonas sp.]